MTRRSPCLTCTDVGPNKDKSSHTCMMCYRRIEYVRSIGGMTHSLDIEEASVSKKAACKTVGCFEEATPSGYCKRCQSRNWYRKKHGIPIDAPLDKTRSFCAIQKGEKQVETTESYGKQESLTETVSDPVRAEIPESEGYGMNIDLTDYPEVHSYFIQKAQEELRSIPNQILWTLLQIVRGER